VPDIRELTVALKAKLKTMACKSLIGAGAVLTVVWSVVLVWTALQFLVL
jgi:hypothetical protein